VVPPAALRARRVRLVSRRVLQGQPVQAAWPELLVLLVQAGFLERGPVQPELLVRVSERAGLRVLLVRTFR